MLGVYSVRVVLCSCRLGICLLFDFDGWWVGLILVFVSALASHDF